MKPQSLWSSLGHHVMKGGLRWFASFVTQGSYSGTWSPNSRFIASCSQGKLYFFAADKGTFSHLKCQADFVINPVFSPDSKTLAYYGATLQDTTLVWSIWLRDLTAHQEGNLAAYRMELPASPGMAPVLQTGLTLAWHPDGYRLACTRMFLDDPTDETYAIEIIDLTDEYVVSLKQPLQKQRYPLWSPDGKSLAYAVETDNDVSGYQVSALDLCVAERDGEHPRKLWESSTQAKLWPFAVAEWKADNSGLIVLAMTPEVEAENRLLDSRHPLQVNFAPLDGTPGKVRDLPTGIMAVSPDLQAIVYLDEDEKSLMYSLAPFSESHVLDVLPEKASSSMPPSPLLSPDGGKIGVMPVPIVGTKRYALYLYDVASGRKTIHPLP